MPSRPEGDTTYLVIQAFSTQLKRHSKWQDSSPSKTVLSETVVSVNNSLLAFCSPSASCHSSMWSHLCHSHLNGSLHKVTILCSEAAPISSTVPCVKWCLAYSSTSWKDLENNAMQHSILNVVTMFLLSKMWHIVGSKSHIRWMFPTFINPFTRTEYVSQTPSAMTLASHREAGSQSRTGV